MPAAPEMSSLGLRSLSSSVLWEVLCLELPREGEACGAHLLKAEPRTVTAAPTELEGTSLSPRAGVPATESPKDSSLPPYV